MAMRLERDGWLLPSPGTTKRGPFRYLRASPEVIRLAVMLWDRFPLALWNMEDLLHERKEAGLKNKQVTGDWENSRAAAARSPPPDPRDMNADAGRGLKET